MLSINKFMKCSWKKRVPNFKDRFFILFYYKKNNRATELFYCNKNDRDSQVRIKNNIIKYKM